ncbi:hypothetical protein Bca101_091918 [Brassica carinata]
MDILMDGFENTDLALHYGAMFRECIRHQIVAKYVLESEHELLTRHKSTVAEFLTKNEDWFFADYNSMCVCVLFSLTVFFLSTAEAERYMGNTRKRENKGTCST